MADEQAAANWSLKDALIAVPFLASALAVTWEVGYFVRIRGGAFGLFNIAEHLTFALQALPIALAVTGLFLTTLVRGSVTFRPVRFPRVKAKLQTLLQTYGGRLGLRLVALLVIALLVAGLYFSILNLILVVAMVTGALGYLLSMYAPRQLLTNPLMIYGSICWAFFAALSIGFDTARNQIGSSLPLNTIKINEKGKGTETEINVRILRTGERGILYYDPATRGFALLPWDGVKRIDWALSSLLDPQ